MLNRYSTVKLVLVLYSCFKNVQKCALSFVITVETVYVTLI